MEINCLIVMIPDNYRHWLGLVSSECSFHLNLTLNFMFY